MAVRFGIDTGGTCTDLVGIDDVTGSWLSRRRCRYRVRRRERHCP